MKLSRFELYEFAGLLTLIGWLFLNYLIHQDIVAIRNMFLTFFLNIVELYAIFIAISILIVLLFPEKWYQKSENKKRGKKCQKKNHN